MNKQKRNLILIILGVLVAICLLVWLVVLAESKKTQSKFLEVDFFDVGQGDAIFIETPGRRQILIDGGPDSTVLRKLAREMPFYDREIDIVILTHPDDDHITGIVDVLKNYKVNLVIDSGFPKISGAYKEYLEIIDEKRILYSRVRLGQRIKIGENIYLDILHPPQGFLQRCDKANNASVVVRLVYGEDSFLFAGDIEKQVEYELVYKNLNLDSDVLKVGHHGSKTSSGELFLEKISPEIAVISVGRNNKFGHPAKEVLERLPNIRLFRTDLDGDIEIFADGERLYVNQ